MTGMEPSPTGPNRTSAVALVGKTLALVPRNVGVIVLRTYRAIVSPLYGDVCRYYPSCSHYSLQAVQAHGLVKGSWLTARRLIRCHPWARGGIDDIPPGTRTDIHLTAGGFVAPNRQTTN
jgi:putative membrane protein insertion efficiency factor